MAQHVLPDGEEVPALLREDAVDEVRRVLVVGSLVPHDQAPVDFAQLHLVLQHLLLKNVSMFYDLLYFLFATFPKVRNYIRVLLPDGMIFSCHLIPRPGFEPSVELHQTGTFEGRSTH